MLRRFDHRHVREWCDITLAARERYGDTFFRKSAAAYLMDNLNKVALGTRTPPDWWAEMRKEEERRQAHRDRHRRDVEGKSAMPARAMDAFEDIEQAVFEQFRTAGQTESVAKENASRFARARRATTHKL